MMPCCYHDDSGHDAFVLLKTGLDDLDRRMGINHEDLLFLKNVMKDEVIAELVQVQDILEAIRTVDAAGDGNSVELLEEVVHTLGHLQGSRHLTGELLSIFKNVYFKALLDAYDAVVKGKHSFVRSAGAAVDSFDVENMPEERSRVIRLQKNPNESLGITVQVENDQLTVARILDGGLVDRCKILRIGDKIKEINQAPVRSVEEMIEKIKASGTELFLTVTTPSQSLQEDTIDSQASSVQSSCPVVYMRVLFSYDPTEDSLLPCPDIGLSFSQGDVLEVVDRKDPNWWQARRVGSRGPARLIPSQELEERRKAFVPPEHDYVHKTGMCGTKISKKKVKSMYRSKNNSDFDKAELILYEEVVRSPPFHRKTLVLVGAPRVGRRTLKQRLLSYDPERFATILPRTSRPPRENEQNGQTYHFVTRESMEHDIHAHLFLEWGEHGDHLYGLHTNDVHEIIRSGRMCVLDVAPGALKALHGSADLLPYVVFIASPSIEQLRFMNDYGRVMGLASSQRTLTLDRSFRYSSRRARTLQSLASFYEEEDILATIEESARIQRTYEKYFDLELVNEDFEMTFQKLVGTIESLSQESTWIPVQWIY